jgi:hypothetical protein
MLQWEADPDGFSWLFRFDACFSSVPRFMHEFSVLVRSNMMSDHTKICLDHSKTHLKISQRNLTLRVVVDSQDHLTLATRIIQDLYDRTHFVDARVTSLPESITSLLMLRDCHLYTPHPLPRTRAILITCDKNLQFQFAAPMLEWVNGELRRNAEQPAEEPYKQPYTQPYKQPHKRSRSHQRELHKPSAGLCETAGGSSNHLLLSFLDTYHSDKFGSFGQVGL